MKAIDLVPLLLKHPDCEIEVIVHNKVYPFTLAYGSEGEGGAWKTISFYVDELNQGNEQ